MVGVGAVMAGGAAAVLSTGALKGALDSVSLITVNGGLAAMYGLFMVWGVTSVVFAIISDDDGAKVNMASYIVVTTVTHYGITFGGTSVVEGMVSYPVEPALLYRGLDAIVLVSAITLLVFFFDPDTLVIAPIVGSGLMTVSMTGQTYKAAQVLQGIWQGTRDDTTGKLLSALE